jgi:hypothetical protein
MFKKRKVTTDVCGHRRVSLAVEGYQQTLPE